MFFFLESNKKLPWYSYINLSVSELLFGPKPQFEVDFLMKFTYADRQQVGEGKSNLTSDTTVRKNCPDEI